MEHHPVPQEKVDRWIGKEGRIDGNTTAKGREGARTHTSVDMSLRLLTRAEVMLSPDTETPVLLFWPSITSAFTSI